MCVWSHENSVVSPNIIKYQNNHAFELRIRFYGCISCLIIFLSNYITDIIRTLLKNNAFVHSKSERLSVIKSFYTYSTKYLRGLLVIYAVFGICHCRSSLNSKFQLNNILNTCSVKQKAENIFNVIKYFVTLDICSPRIVVV